MSLKADEQHAIGKNAQKSSEDGGHVESCSSWRNRHPSSSFPLPTQRSTRSGGDCWTTCLCPSAPAHRNPQPRQRPCSATRILTADVSEKNRQRKKSETKPCAGDTCWTTCP